MNGTHCLHRGCRRIAKEVLLALPEWFGIPESTEEYIAESGGQPFWAALGPDGRAAGFIALKATSEHTCEVAVMGVLRPRQGRGLGRSLMDAALRWAAGARPGPRADGRGAPLGGGAGL